MFQGRGGAAVASSAARYIIVILLVDLKQPIAMLFAAHVVEQEWGLGFLFNFFQFTF